MNPALIWSVPALLAVSVALWRVARDHVRLKASWALLFLAGMVWAVSQVPGALKPAIAVGLVSALFKLAAVQVGSVFVVDLVFRKVHIPKFAVELLLVASYLAILVEMLYKVGVNVSGLFATSAVAAAAAGLALQDMLTNIAGGITLELERDLQVGDFIKAGETSGWVQHVRLRHTSIVTSDGDSVILPNSQLTKSAVLIVGRAHRQKIPFYMSYEVNPHEVVETVEFALRSSPIPGVAAAPAPQCVLREMSAGQIGYWAIVWLARPGHDTSEVSAVLTRIYFALKRAGIPVVSIAQDVELRKPKEAEPANLAPVNILRRTPILRLLSEEDLFALSAGMQPLSFTKGEHLVSQGESGDSMFFLVSGSVGISYRSLDGVESQVAVTQAGDFFGELSLLTGERRSATAIALSRVDCYRLDKAGLQNMVTRIPDLPVDMSVVMSHRQMELDVVREKVDQETARRRAAENQKQLLDRIRGYFSVPKQD